MKLLEFITYCKLKDLIESQQDFPILWDSEADSHHKIIIVNGKYTATIKYALLKNQAVIMNSNLWMQTDLGTECFSQPSVNQIVNAILEGEHESA